MIIEPTPMTLFRLALYGVELAAVRAAKRLLCAPLRGLGRVLDDLTHG